jgi:hypothetical protein
MSFTPATRRYRKVDPQLWQDRVWASLTPLAPSGQALLLFLLTCREGHFIPGLILLGLAAAAEILGWTVEATRAALDELIEAGEVLADVRARLIFLRRAVLENQPANPNVVTGWATTWHEVADCDLKEIIRRELEASLRHREPSFMAAFRVACPNRLANGFRNGSGNQDPDTDRELELELEQEPEQDLESGPGVSGAVLAGYPSGQVHHGVTGEGVGAGSGSLSGAGASPGATAFDERTFDDLLDLPPGTSPAPPPTARPVQVVGREVTNDPSGKAQALIDDWNTKVAGKNPIFERVDGKAAEDLLPAISKALAQPGAAEDFQALFDIIPNDDFYFGKNDKGFVAFLAHYVRQSPSGRAAAAEVARKKLARLKQGRAAKPKSKAEQEAAAARKGLKTGTDTPSPTNTNDLHTRLGAGATRS